jgi:cytochrome d ubiquinol oxidase subunit II
MASCGCPATDLEAGAVFDYETLKLIWWVFMGALLIGFAVMDGFDMGIGALLPLIGKTNSDRRIMINSIGPTWEGNQVWFITAGGALFAAWPMVYAAAFSGFYIALILVLFALILRPVGFDFRSKVDHTRWRALWDACLFIGGTVPALVFGVAFGNLLLGVPFHYSDELRPIYTGSFLGLLGPFPLLTGIVSLSMLIMHGGCFLQIRSEAVLRWRAQAATIISAGIYIFSFALAGVWIWLGIDGYRIVDMPDLSRTITPVQKVVAITDGGWLENYQRWGWLWLFPTICFIGALGVILFSRAKRGLPAFLCSATAVSGTLLTAGLSMFPFVMPSSSNPNHSLTLWDVTSSHYTLGLMFWAVVIFLPIIIIYTSWVYRVMRGRISAEDIEKNTHTAY